jgi:hypothetical protein
MDTENQDFANTTNALSSIHAHAIHAQTDTYKHVSYSVYASVAYFRPRMHKYAASPDRQFARISQFASPQEQFSVKILGNMAHAVTDTYTHAC